MRGRLSHVHLLILGWTFYLAVPMALATLGKLDDVVGAAPFTDYFSQSSVWWPALWSYVAFLPVAYFLGIWIARKLRLPRLPQAAGGRMSRGLALLCAGLLVFYTYQARDLLFTGYLEGVDSSLVGPLATLQVLLLFEWLTCKAGRDGRFVLIYGLLLTICSAVLLGMGGRLYVVTALVAIYFDWWNRDARSAWARRGSLALALMVALIMAVVGMYRLGAVDLSQLTFFLLAEPMYTAISGLSLVLNGSWSLLDTPRDFFSAFINLVPADIWPGKLQYVSSLLDSDLDLESPFGALSIVASTIGNFGYLGGLSFVAFVGFVLEWARRQTTSPVGRALYVLLSSLLLFMFFRDPFRVQIKVFLTCLLLACLHAVLRSPSSVRAVAPALRARS